MSSDTKIMFILVIAVIFHIAIVLIALDRRVKKLESYPKLSIGRTPADCGAIKPGSAEKYTEMLMMEEN